jgi:surface antigen
MTPPQKSGDKAVKPKAATTTARKPAVKTNAAAKPAAAKKPATTAKATKSGAVAKPAKPVTTTKPTKAKAGGGALAPDQRRYYIEVAAYYIAERRGFQGGNALEDWAAAEAEVDRLLREGVLNP